MNPLNRRHSAAIEEPMQNARHIVMPTTPTSVWQQRLLQAHVRMLAVKLLFQLSSFFVFAAAC